MTSKEIIKRIIAHDAPPRIGYAFTTNTDFKGVRNRQLINLPDNMKQKLDEYLLRKKPE